MSGRLGRNRKLHCGDRGQGCGQCQLFAFGGALRAAVQGDGGSIRYRDQVIDAEPVAAAIAVELIAAGAEQLAAPGTGADFEVDVAAVFVVLDGLNSLFCKRFRRGSSGTSTAFAGKENPRLRQAVGGYADTSRRSTRVQPPSDTSEQFRHPARGSRIPATGSSSRLNCTMPIRWRS